MGRRKLIAITLFVLDALVCGMWVYREAIAVIDPGAGSGGIAGVSAGIAEMIVEGFITVVPIVVTLVLTRASGSTRLARNWRNAHLVGLFALIILPMMGGLRIILVSIAVFLPVQVFFVIGAVAIWIASPRKPRQTSEASA